MKDSSTDRTDWETFRNYGGGAGATGVMGALAKDYRGKVVSFDLSIRFIADAAFPVFFRDLHGFNFARAEVRL